VYILFGYCCVGTEVFYVLLYIRANYDSFLLEKVSKTMDIFLVTKLFYFVLVKICFYGCLPACVLKQIVNVIQLLSAAEAIAEIDSTDKNS